MIIYFDTETTGLRPGNICQLSYVLEDAYGIQAKNFFFTVDAVEYSAYLVHGFSVQKLFALSKGKRFCDHIEEIAYDFSSADLIVAHNVNFDINFLREEFASLNKQFTFRQDFCSMKASVPLCKLPKSRGTGYKYPKLSELCSFLNIDDASIVRAERLLYGSSTAGHDARFDTAALYLCVKKGGDLFKELNVKEFL